jgi:hypothetical protein
MLDIVHARIARDLTDQQFAAGPRRAARAAEPEATTPRAPVRRGAVRFLRRLADRLEPAPRCAPQS